MMLFDLVISRVAFLYDEKETGLNFPITRETTNHRP
jgi:hypothetical protein